MDALPVDRAQQNSLRNLSFLWLEITNKCNLECVHCYADSRPKEALFGSMQVNDWLNVIGESAELGCEQLQFIGGEPTLHPALEEMIFFASACGFRFIEVFTNATILSESLRRTFVEHGVHIATSFYSDDPETHDTITQHKGSFNRTVEGIKSFLDAGLPIRAGIIEMRENLGHTDRAKNFLNALGVKEVKIDFQRGVGRGSRLISSLNPMTELCGECWKGKLCVTSSGRVYPCVFSRFSDLGTMRNGIQTVLNDDALLNFRIALRDYQEQKSFNGTEDLSAKSKAVAARSCDPDTECGPDVECAPTSSGCSPMVFHPCGPECDPSPSECAPMDVCSPDRRPVSLSSCNPTCAPCGPATFCVPARICAPERKCDPTSGPCTPDRKCVPDFRTCVPDFRTCVPDSANH